MAKEKKPAEKSASSKTAAAKAAASQAEAPKAGTKVKKAPAQKPAAEKVAAAAASASSAPERSNALVSPSPAVLQEEIRIRAYEIFCERGGHHGAHETDWQRAEREVRAKYE